MKLLLDKLPTSVNIEGKEYAIASDFRASMAFELLVQDSSLAEPEILLKALKLYYPEIPDNLEQAVEKLLWFYRCGSDIHEPAAGGGSACSAQGPAYSFDEDAPYFYAAYLAQYGIDLQDIKYLHWWKFKAMMDSLPEDCRLVQIMSYRSIPLSAGMSKEQREFYTKMKRIFALRSKGPAKNSGSLADYEQGMIEYVNRRYQEAEDKGQST